MRNTALVGVIFCLALSSAFATGVVEAFLEKAAETPFGRTLIETIELELQSAAPGDRFFKMLGQMKAAQEADIKSLADTNTRTQAKCKQDLTLLKREIKNSARIVVDSKKQVKKDSRHRAWAENQKESNQRQLAEASTNYNKIKDLRKAEINDYTKKINEINEALKVLHEGKNLIESNLKAPAFVQVANVFNSYVEKMTREIVSQEYKGRGYVSVVSYIGELLQKAKVQANQGSVQRIRKAIQDIIDQLENTKTFENNAEKERKANFVQLKNIYKKSIGELRESIQKFTTIIDQLKKNIKSSMSNVRLHTKNIRVKGRQKRKRTRECQTALNLFNKENKRRQTQLSIVVEAIKLIEDNKDEFRKIVLSNAKAAIDSRYGKK